MRLRKWRLGVLCAWLGVALCGCAQVGSRPEFVEADQVARAAIGAEVAGADPMATAIGPEAAPVEMAGSQPVEAYIGRALAENRGVQAARFNLIAMKERAASDPARRRSKALRDLADAALLRGDVPDPEEGW